MGEEKSGRSHLLPLLAIGAITSACGIALGLAINWFPVAGLGGGQGRSTRCGTSS